MNKLEQYKHEMTITGQAPKGYKSIQIQSYIQGLEDGSLQGFDAAIALNLPVKFAEYWYKISSGCPTQNDYLYWIDNIYEPE